MFVSFLFLLCTTPVFADVELYTKTINTSGTSVTQKNWFVFEKRYHIGNVLIQVDTYSTSNAPSTASNPQKNRFSWGLDQLRGSRQKSSSAKPVILEDQRLNQLTTETQVNSESPALGSTTSSTWKDRIRWLLSATLLTTCAATWLVFFLHVMRLYKLIQDRSQNTMKSGPTKSRSTKASLMVPLLAHEGSTKQKKTMLP